PLDAAPPIEAASPFAGVFAHIEVQTGTAELPVFGADRVVQRGYSRWTITSDGEALQVESETCGVEIERETDLVRTELPQRFIDALPHTFRPAQVEGARFVAPTFVEVRAAALDDPENDPLPTMADDPRVIDLDTDGHPGLTVRISGLLDGDVYVVQRTRTALEGTLDGDRLDGRLVWRNEESILGADNPALLTGAPVEPDPDPAAHYFRSTRVDPVIDCPAIIANAGALFARTGVR
ncbi:MAG: hypothetical protein KC583_16560, partial [Myxococcales bacterium]|nr:hypothetical protein [Myxococcales bacterium]